MLEQVNAGTAGNARQNRANTRSGINGTVDLKEAVHGANLFYILMLYAIQQHFISSSKLAASY